MKKLLTLSVAVCLLGAMISCNQNTAVVGADMDKKIDSLKQKGLENLQTEMDAKCSERLQSDEFKATVDSLMKTMKAA